MKKNNENSTRILTTIICLIPIVIGIILYPRFPDTIVTHWDGNGIPNGMQSKFVGIIVFPGILLLLNLFMPTLMTMDPKYENMDGKLKTLVLWIIPIVEMFASGTTISYALGKDIPVVTTGTVLLGVVFAAIGNYMPKTKQSYTLGIKLPWTLNSEENWNRTHRLAGFIWVIGGICMIVCGIFGYGTYAIPVVVLIMILVPTVYSYLLYKKGI